MPKYGKGYSGKKGSMPKDSQKQSLGSAGKTVLPGNEKYTPPERGYTGANVVGSKAKTWC
jgi:hypothetical protein